MTVDQRTNASRSTRISDNQSLANRHTKTSNHKKINNSNAANEDAQEETKPLVISIPPESSSTSGTKQWVSLDLQELTGPTARIAMIESTVSNAGTSLSRSGRYHRPTFRQYLGCNTHLRLSFLCLFVIVGLIVSASCVQVIMSRRGAGAFSSYSSPPIVALSEDDLLIVNDYSRIGGVSDLNLGNVDHWCLDGGNDCSCNDPLEPMNGARSTVSDHGHHEDPWTLAFRMNQKLVENATMTSMGTTFQDGEQKKLDVVFLGDSITEEWNGRWFGRFEKRMEGIRKVFDVLFRKENGSSVEGLALGIAADTSPKLLWRIKNGEMPKYLNPKVWWILIGTNDLLLTKCSEEIVLIGIIRVVEEILYQKPNSKIVINGILPTTKYADGRLCNPEEEEDEYEYEDKNVSLHVGMHHGEKNNKTKKKYSVNLWKSISSINLELKRFSKKHENVEYFDASQIFLASFGNDHFKREEKFLMKELMDDYLHPTAIGHELWGKAILKKLADLKDLDDDLII